MLIKLEAPSNRILLNTALAYEIRYQEAINFYLAHPGVDGSKALEKYFRDSLAIQEEILKRMEGK